jgi:hypothetical protein
MSITWLGPTPVAPVAPVAPGPGGTPVADPGRTVRHRAGKFDRALAGKIGLDKVKITISPLMVSQNSFPS